MATNSFNEVINDGEGRYRDQLLLFQLIKVTINEIFIAHGIEKALDIAEVVHVQGSTHVGLQWRPVYPVSRKTLEWDAEDAYAYENDYAVGMEIFANGMDGNYNVQIGWKCDIPKNLILSETGVVAAHKLHKAVKIPDEWLRQIKMIILDAPRRAKERAAAPVPTTLFGKIKASIALRKN